MEQKKPIIVGIDPGTTTAYACLDLGGGVVAIGSAKELGMSRLITDVSLAGRPVIAATDKAAVPSFVHDFAAKTGAKLFTPKEDLLVREKLEAVKKLKEPSYINTHEMDALAAALFAYRKNLPLIRKLTSFIEKNGRKDITNELARLVITKGVPITLAEERIDRQNKLRQKEPQTQNGVGQQHNEGTKEIAALNRKNSVLSEEVFLLKAESRRLYQKQRKLEDALSAIQIKNTRKLNREKAKQGIVFKEKTISRLNSEINEKDEKIKELLQEVDRAYSMMESIGRYFIVKPIDNLGSAALKNLKLKKGDIVYVKNAAEFSKATVDSLQGSALSIITPNAPSEIRKRFTVIDAKKLELIMPSTHSPYLLVKRADFERLIDEKGILDRIISEYGEEKDRQNK